MEVGWPEVLLAILFENNGPLKLAVNLPVFLLYELLLKVELVNMFGVCVGGWNVGFSGWTLYFGGFGFIYSLFLNKFVLVVLFVNILLDTLLLSISDIGLFLVNKPPLPTYNALTGSGYSTLNFFSYIFIFGVFALSLFFVNRSAGFEVKIL